VLEVSAPHKRGRGRPKSAATLAREKIEALFASRPSYLPKEESALTKALREAKPHNDAIEQKILSDYKYDATVPDEHAFTMASLGDESLYGHETVIIAKDKAHKARVARQRSNGARATKQNSRNRAEAIIAKNKVLISQLIGSRKHSVSCVAKKICSEWDRMTVAQRIYGEPASLTTRGDGGPCPSERTIRNWIKQYDLPSKSMLEKAR
jgi:hypothetical protein